MTRFLTAALIVSLASPGLASSAPAEDDPFDQSGVPLEVLPKDPSLAKVVLVAGRQSHGPRTSGRAPRALRIVGCIRTGWPR